MHQEQQYCFSHVHGCPGLCRTLQVMHFLKLQKYILHILKRLFVLFKQWTSFVQLQATPDRLSNCSSVVAMIISNICQSPSYCPSHCQSLLFISPYFIETVVCVSVIKVVGSRLVVLTLAVTGVRYNKTNNSNGLDKR